MGALPPHRGGLRIALNNNGTGLEQYWVYCVDSNVFALSLITVWERKEIVLAFKYRWIMESWPGVKFLNVCPLFCKDYLNDRVPIFLPTPPVFLPLSPQNLKTHPYFLSFLYISPVPFGLSFCLTYKYLMSNILRKRSFSDFFFKYTLSPI